MTTPSQARNSIKRALLHVAGIKFGQDYRERCREYFNGLCCYCGEKPDERQGGYDHAEAIASSSTRDYYLVYACNKCNGDEKRESDWLTFLRKKYENDEAAFRARKEAILAWFRDAPKVRISDSTKKAWTEALSTAVDGFNQAVSRLQKQVEEESRANNGGTPS